MKIILSFLMILVLISCNNEGDTEKKNTEEMKDISETNDHKNALIVAEYADNEKGGSVTYLVSYNFEKGALVSKDTILMAPRFMEGHEGSYVGYDFDGNFIYKNRYVISTHENVIDLDSKKLIKEGGDLFVEATGDSILFYRKSESSDSGFLVCDLKTESYEFIENKNFRNIAGIPSPNHHFSLEIVNPHLPYSIGIINLDQERETIVKDCGIGTSQSAGVLFGSNIRSTVPTIWIDNSNFLYAEIIPISDYVSITLRLVNIESKSNTVITSFDSLSTLQAGGFFFKDACDNVLFSGADGEYMINIDNRTKEKQKSRAIGNSFEVNLGGGFDHSLIYEGDTIGRLWCKAFEGVTAKGYLAVEYGAPQSNLGYPEGVKVWCSLSETWTTLEIPFISALIGWRDE